LGDLGAGAGSRCGRGVVLGGGRGGRRGLHVLGAHPGERGGSGGRDSRRRRLMATERKASVTWQGDLMSGHGTIESVTSGVLGPLEVDWANRAEDAQGKTSPEELIAAAHAACFAMALSHGLAQDGHAPERLETSATITFVPGTGITKSALTVVGTVPGLDEAAFKEAAEDAGQNCPVSGALKNNVELTLDARLQS